MKAAIVDASVAAKWLVDEPGSDAAEALRASMVLHAPAHWRAETANVVWSKFLKGELTQAQVLARVSLLDNAPVRETPLSTLMLPAAEIATQCRITIYDALYVALAVRRGIRLITADRRLCARLRQWPGYADVAVAFDELTEGEP